MGKEVEEKENDFPGLFLTTQKVKDMVPILKMERECPVCF
jgi:hypothetical protein